MAIEAAAKPPVPEAPRPAPVASDAGQQAKENPLRALGRKTMALFGRKQQAEAPTAEAALRALAQNDQERSQDMRGFYFVKAGEPQRQTDAILASRQGISGEPVVNRAADNEFVHPEAAAYADFARSQAEQAAALKTQAEAPVVSSAGERGSQNVIAGMRAELDAQPISEPVPLPKFIQDLQRQQAAAGGVKEQVESGQGARGFVTREGETREQAQAKMEVRDRLLGLRNKHPDLGPALDSMRYIVRDAAFMEGIEGLTDEDLLALAKQNAGEKRSTMNTAVTKLLEQKKAAQEEGQSQVEAGSGTFSGEASDAEIAEAGEDFPRKPEEDAQVNKAGEPSVAQDTFSPSLAEEQEAAEADAHARVEIPVTPVAVETSVVGAPVFSEAPLPSAEAVEAVVAAPKTPEDAGRVIAEIQDTLLQEQYDAWQKKWIDEVCEAYLDKNKRLGPDAQGNYAIPQARGVFEDPLYQRIFADETQRAHLEGRIGRPSELFRNAITRYRTEKDQATRGADGRIVLPNGIPSEMARDNNFAQAVGERVLNRLGIAAGLPQDEAFRGEVLTSITNTLRENRTLTEADVVKAQADVVKAREDALLAAKKAEEDNFLANHEQLAKDWVESVYKAHIQEGKVLDANAAERFAIPQAKGMVEDPAYIKILNEETDLAQARRDGANRAVIFRNTITRYKAGKDAQRLAQLRAERGQERQQENGQVGVAGAQVVNEQVREAVTRRVGEAGGMTTEGVKRITAEEIAAFNKKAYDEITNLGLAINADTKPEDLMAQLVTPERGWQDDEPTRNYVRQAIEHVKAEQAKQEVVQSSAVVPESIPLEVAGSVAVPESSRTETAEEPLTSREQVMQARMDKLEAQLEAQNKTLEQLTRQNEKLTKIIAEVLPRLIQQEVDKETDPKKREGLLGLFAILNVLFEGVGSVATPEAVAV